MAVFGFRMKNVTKISTPSGREITSKPCANDGDVVTDDEIMLQLQDSLSQALAMARGHNLNLIAYLIEMALLDTSDRVNSDK